MKRIKLISIVALLILTVSCGRDECGFIKNNTGETVTVNIRLQNVDSDPTKYLLDDALNGSSKSSKYDIDNYFISYDSLSNILSFRLMNNEQLKLGTMRLDMTRDSLKYWEFDSISAIGEGVEINASGKDVLKLIEIDRSLFTQNSHFLILK
tara:strand:- start:1 stop:456 length:456 start_codon:yes stop_codon:yes gene_type:complete